MKVDAREVLAAAFYLNKLNLPADKDMTAYEVSERLAEYIRSIGPVVEPFEADNTGILDNTFAMGVRLGHMGKPDEIPEEILDADISYEFDTPVQLAYRRQKMVRAKETAEFAGGIVQSTGKEEVLDNYDWDKIARSGGRSIDGDADWLVDIETRDERRAQRAALAEAQMSRQQTAETVGNLNAMADVAQKGVDIGQQVGALPPPEGQTGDNGAGGGVPALPGPGGQGGGQLQPDWPEEVDEQSLGELLDLGAEDYDEVA